jgi:hypothetical protein
MDEFAVPLRSSNIPLRMGQATIASFQERVLKEGLPRIDETLTEADVLRQFSLEGRDIAGIIQKIGSLKTDKDMELPAEYEALRASMERLSFSVKNVQASFP